MPRSAKIPAWDSRAFAALAQSKYTWARRRALSRVPEARRWGSAPTKFPSSGRLDCHSMSTMFYLYTQDCQRSAATRDRPQDMNHASRTTCKSSVRAVKRVWETNTIALSMMLLRHAPEGPAKAMSCVIRPDQGQAMALCVTQVDIPRLTSLTGSLALSYESRSKIARSVPEPACPAFKSSRAD